MARVLLAAVTLPAMATLSACGGSTPDSTPAPAAAAVAPVPPPKVSPPAALAEAANSEKTVAVQILAAKRVAPDTLRLELALINTADGQASFDIARILPNANGAEASLDRLCLLSADGSRRIFVLRDADGKALQGGSLEPLRPAERRIVWALFPAPPSESSQLTVLLGDMVFKDVPIS